MNKIKHLTNENNNIKSVTRSGATTIVLILILIVVGCIIYFQEYRGHWNEIEVICNSQE